MFSDFDCQVPEAVQSVMRHTPCSGFCLPYIDDCFSHFCTHVVLYTSLRLHHYSHPVLKETLEFYFVLSKQIVSVLYNHQDGLNTSRRYQGTKWIL